jgi:hypothetical protein
VHLDVEGCIEWARHGFDGCGEAIADSSVCGARHRNGENQTITAKTSIASKSNVIPFPVISGPAMEFAAAA